MLFVRYSARLFLIRFHALSYLTEVFDGLPADADDAVEVNGIRAALARTEGDGQEEHVFFCIHHKYRQHDIGKVKIRRNFGNVSSECVVLHQTVRRICIRDLDVENHAEYQLQHFRYEYAGEAVLAVVAVSDNRRMIVPFRCRDDAFLYFSNMIALRFQLAGARLPP